MRELTTERLLLRRLERSDAGEMFSTWASDPEVTRFLTWLPHESADTTKELLAAWEEEYQDPRCYRWGLVRREDGRLMGSIDVTGYRDGLPMIGYCMGREFWGRGYMTEALAAVVDCLFEDGFSGAIVEAVDENTGSNRVIQKNGFRLDSTRREAISSLKPDQVVTINSYILRR